MGFTSDIPSLGNQLPISLDFPSDQNAFRDRIQDVYQSIASAVNSKIGGLYSPIEKITSEQYFDPLNISKYKNVYRKVVDFGALPNASTKSVLHGIDFSENSYLTHLYSAASDPINFEYLPLPFASPVLASNISLSIDQNNINITTGSDRTAFTTCYVVIQYVKG